MLYRHIHSLLIALSLCLLAVGCTDDEREAADATADPQPVAFVVTQQPWRDENVNLTTRSTTTLDGLKVSTTGFGLFCSDFHFANQQVLWEHEAWNYGNSVLWSMDKTKAYNLYAYAPYDATLVASAATNTLTFTCAEDNQVDLLWASQTGVVRDDENSPVELNFRHALGKISLGTIANSTGHSITLVKLVLKSKLYTGGTLSLADGTWSDLAGGTDVQTIEHSVGQTFDSNTAIAANAPDLLQIPGVEATVELIFTIEGFDKTNEDIKFTTTFEQGVSKNFNITIEKNFEVIITQ